jgi:hypothetical protein
MASAASTYLESWRWQQSVAAISPALGPTNPNWGFLHTAKPRDEIGEYGTGVGRTLHSAILDCVPNPKYLANPEYIANPEYLASLEYAATTTVDVLPPNTKRELAGVERYNLRAPARQP